MAKAEDGGGMVLGWKCWRKFGQYLAKFEKLVQSKTMDMGCFELHINKNSHTNFSKVKTFTLVYFGTFCKKWLFLLPIFPQHFYWLIFINFHLYSLQHILGGTYSLLQTVLVSWIVRNIRRSTNLQTHSMNYKLDQN